MRLLVVEDDDDLRQELSARLREAGFAVDAVDNGMDAEFQGDEVDYDAVILDLGLPDREGLGVLGHWRARGRSLPVLVLTARDAWYEKVEGFKAGADDYLGKPFHIEELIARLRALVRRGGGQGGQTLLAGGLLLDEDARQATLEDGVQVPLTRIEYRLLRTLMQSPDKLFSKMQLAEHVYDDETENDSNVMEVYVRRLRRKLGNDRIETVRGQGYRFKH